MSEQLPSWIEKRNALRAELSQLDEATLRDRWTRNDYTLWEFEQDAEKYGYSSLGNEYMSYDLEAENSLINEVLKEWGLEEQVRHETLTEDDDSGTPPAAETPDGPSASDAWDWPPAVAFSLAEDGDLVVWPPMADGSDDVFWEDDDPDYAGEYDDEEDDDD